MLGFNLSPPEKRHPAPGIAAIVVAASILIAGGRDATLAAPTVDIKSTAPKSTAPSTAPAIVAAVVSRVAGISAYTARVTAHVRMRNFPFIRATFSGTTSFQRPGQFTVKLNNATLANSYQYALENMGDPGQWMKSYDISMARDQPCDAGTVVLRLSPKTSGPIDHTLARVRLATMTVDEIDWHYTNGGRIVMRQQYAPVNGMLMVSHQDIEIAMPNARLFARTDLDGYSVTSELRSALVSPPR